LTVKPPAGFRPIPGEHGDYWAAADGRIWSRPRWRTKGGIIAAYGPATRQQVGLAGGRKVPVSRLVDRAWTSSPVDKTLLDDIRDCLVAADSARKRGQITVGASQLRTAALIAAALAERWHPGRR
jgi:hypothetical protein